MRIEILSGRVYETESPAELLAELHVASQYRSESFRSYLEGFVDRLRPLRIASTKTWLEAPAKVAAGDDRGYARWLGQTLMDRGRWKETDAPTEDEKEAKAKAAAEAKAKAAAEKKAAVAKAAVAKAAVAKAAVAKAVAENAVAENAAAVEQAAAADKREAPAAAAPDEPASDEP